MFDLLDNLDRFGVGQVQVPAAAGAGVEEVVGGGGGEHLGREQLARCAVCPGWPPGWRRSWPGGGCGLGGLTMSEEGGLDELEEFLRAAASCFCNCSTTTWRATS